MIIGREAREESVHQRNIPDRPKREDLAAKGGRGLWKRGSRRGILGKGGRKKKATISGEARPQGKKGPGGKRAKGKKFQKEGYLLRGGGRTISSGKIKSPSREEGVSYPGNSQKKKILHPVPDKRHGGLPRKKKKTMNLFPRNAL